MSPRRHRWYSARAMRLHLMVALAVPGCLFAGWWQAERAMSGNALSYLYAVEWPIFAVLAVWGWWQLLNAPPASGDQPAVGGALRWSGEEESPRLRAYNEYLGRLQEAQRRRHGEGDRLQEAQRRPHGEGGRPS